MAKSYRIERINGTIRAIISEMILYRIKDPRVGMVTITEVKISNDLSSAKVFYSLMGDDAQRKECHQGLVSAKNFMRREIVSELDVRVPPDLVFVYDDTLDRAERIDRTLRESAEELADSRGDESIDSDGAPAASPDDDTEARDG